MSAPAILAIDTATELCSVALLQARLVERSEAVGQKHSDRVLPLVDEVLREGGLQLADVDAFAFGAGPGSFTGLRIACGVVQGLAYARKRPVVAVGNLRSLAAAAFAGHPRARVALVAIDARMHEAYCAVYRNDDDVTELRAAALESPAALDAIRREVGADLVAGDALSAFPGAWANGGDVRLPRLRGSAGDIARLARIDIARGRAVAAAEAMPLYVRDRVALTIDERRQRVTA
ncbi:MAG: tRNA (adenosine(37)-N6)-threonylcarbamoyltransferase complex dimerization subunit type 1 TsaB [Betaproteobacteria bacterium]